MTKDPRENDNICTEQVIELACELASKQLQEYWAAHYSDMEMHKLDENGQSTGCYTDKAQDVFNDLYDEVEGDIIDAMEANPSMDIREIQAVVNNQRGA